jgi:diacylglycerol kinase family enzyme
VSRLLIANPWATGVDEARLAAVLAALPEDTELRMTSARGEATRIARDVSDGHADALYVFGGDGTYNEVLNGIDATTPIGLIPGGGTSVLPRALGLPNDPVAAARRLATGSTHRISVGRVNGRRFGFACGIGLDAEVVRAVDELGRRSDGRRPSNLRFAWTGVRTLGRHRFQLEPALEVVDHGRAAFALVSNGPAYSYAGRVAVRPAPHASFEGGLDLVAPIRLGTRELPRFAWYAFGRGDRAKAHNLVYLHDADRIEIVCDSPMPLEVDGEDLGDVERVVIEAERDAVTVLV